MTDERSKPLSELRYLDAVFPDAHAVVGFDPKPLKQSIGNGVFVLDTNALLVPFGTSASDLEAIRATFTKLLKEKRLFLPAQVAREFAKNRPERLKDLYERLANFQSSIKVPAGIQSPLLQDLPEYRAVKSVEVELSTAAKKYRSAVSDLLTTVRSWYWDDPVSAMYRSLFTPNVVIDPALDANFAKEYAFRSSHRIPPGYKDGAKELGAAGDLIIWKTILEIGRREKRDLLFVSGEEKSDWWHRANNEPLYPRFELLDEYRRASEGCTFHILPLADVLKELGVDQTVVDAVRQEEVSLRPISDPSAAWAGPAVSAVEEWLRGFGRVAYNGGTGYRVLDRGGAKTNIEVRLVHRPQAAAPKVYRAIDGAVARQALPFMVVLVARTYEIAKSLAPTIEGALRARPLPANVTVQLGALTEGGFLSVAKLWPPTNGTT